MPDIELWLPGALGMVVLVLASGFFSSSETAMFYLSHDELRGFRRGQRREQQVAVLLGDADRLLTAVLFWNLLINLAYFAISVVVVHRLADEVSKSAAGGFAVGSLLGMIVFGEVLPKSLAVVSRRRLAPLVIWPLSATIRAFDPLAPALLSITRLMRRVAWPDLKQEPRLQAEDLERAVENSVATDEVVRRQRHVLHNILDLSEVRIEEVMRPRGMYETWRPPVHLADLDANALAGDCLVICEDDAGSVDLALPLTELAVLPARHLEQVAERVVQVPWCANLAWTLEQLRKRFASVVGVVNEYGETIGIVTYGDLVDTILATVPSRARRLLKRDPIEEVGPSEYLVDAITSLKDLARRLEIPDRPSADEQLTVAGLLQQQLQRIPRVGDHWVPDDRSSRWLGLRFDVTESVRPGQLRVRVTRQAGPRREAATP